MRHILVKYKKIIFAFILGCSFCYSAHAQVTFGNVKLPNRNMPGDRLATAIINFGGTSRSSVQVYVYYSDNRDDLNILNNNDHFGRASCASNRNGTYTASFIFPHSYHPYPNTLTVAEISGNEPPSDPRFKNSNSNYLLTLATTSTTYPHTAVTYVKTDVNPVKYYSPKTIYCRWVVKRGNRVIKEDIIREFKMPRGCIVALLGDSYAAGEGAPYFTGDMWDNNACHRSENSGYMRAINKTRTEKNDLCFFVFNASCSGAEINNLINDPQRIDNWGNTISAQTPQLRQLLNWLQRNDRNVVDMLLLNIGGNDAGFGSIITSCFFDIGDCSVNSNLRDFVRKEINALTKKYDALQEELSKFNIGCTMIGEYPDPTRGNRGNFCNTLGGNDYAGFCWGPIELSISAVDFSWLYSDVAVKLNEKVRYAAGRHGWTYIGGAMEKSRKFGLCRCDDGYFNVLGQSLSTQGDVRGTVHPNSEGYKEIYRDAVYSKINLCINDLRKQAASTSTSNPLLAGWEMLKVVKSDLLPVTTVILKDTISVANNIKKATDSTILKKVQLIPVKKASKEQTDYETMVKTINEDKSQ